MIFFRKAILLIHGFAGTTKDEEALFYELNHLKKYDVYNFVLPGHDRVTYKIDEEEWIKSASEHLERLISYGYKKIYVVGHSMGGVLASYLAYKYPKYVKKVVLLAPAFDYLTNDTSFVKKVLNGGYRVFKDFSKGEFFGRGLKMTPKMVDSFVDLINKYKVCITKVTCPILIMHGDIDSMVPIKSSYHIYENLISKKKRLVEMEGINHDIFEYKKNEIIIKEIKHFLKNSNYKKNTIIKI